MTQAAARPSVEEPPLDTNLYRKGVGIVLVNPAGLVWVGERSDVKNAWQMPQGGMDEGEDILTAARRELYEETGIRTEETCTLLAIHHQWLSYEWPENTKRKNVGEDIVGVRQKWFLFRYNGKNDEIDLTKAPDKEFTKWKWAPHPEIIKNVVSFRKDVYQDVFGLFEKRMFPVHNA